MPGRTWLALKENHMSTTIIQTTGLSYRYAKDVQTLFDINLHIHKGDIYGFLGPNGSGKTTTLSLLLGLLTHQQGSIEIFGKDIRKHRVEVLRRIGSLIEVPSVYGHLTARENLEVYRPIYGVHVKRVNEVLEIVGLKDAGKKISKKFSLGMKQRLAIALALLPGPELLILDEPSNGLDPNGIIELRQLVKSLNKEHGMTIVISSHILSEVEKMVSHVGIIYKGTMLFQGTLDELHSYQQKDAKLFIRTSNDEAAYSLLREFKPVRTEEALAVTFNALKEVAQINRILTENELDVYLLHPQKNNLEQLFIDLTTEAS